MLIRSHNPTPETLARIAPWIRSVNARKATLGMEVWFSVDTTTLTPASRRSEPHAWAASSSQAGWCGRKRQKVESRSAVRKITSALAAHGLAVGADYNVHEYAEAEMTAAYPVLEELRAAPPVDTCRELVTGSCSLAWGFHAEALNLWFQGLRDVGGRRRYEEVWVMEDDVGWAGEDIAGGFFARFEDEAADLLSAECNRYNDLQWYWARAHSAAFGRRFPLAVRRNGREHVQRFSAKLLDRLHALATGSDSEGRCSAWSESLCVTVCDAEPDLVFKKLPPELLASDCFHYNTRMGQRRWEDIMGGTSSRFRGKLYHALKW